MCKNRSLLIFKLLALLTVAVTLLLLAGGCSLLEDRGNVDVGHTLITDLKVNPQTGSSTFNLTVDYSYIRLAGNRPAIITCEYVRPDAIEGDIGSILPLPPENASQSSANWEKIKNQETLAFSVVRPDGSVQEGSYKALCTTELDYHVEVPFYVKTEAASVLPAEAQAPVAPAEPPKPAETEVVPTPLPVFMLQVEMVTKSENPLKSVWGGNLPINPDGAVRTKLPGTITSTVPYSIAGQHVGTYQVHISFNVDVAGSAELTPDGVKLRLQQTLADYHLDPITVSEGSLDADAMARIQTGIEEAYPNWLDIMVTGLEFEGQALPLTQDSSVGRWTGSATLSQGK